MASLTAGWRNRIYEFYGWVPGDLYHGLGNPPIPELETEFWARRRTRLADISEIVTKAEASTDVATLIALADTLKWTYCDARAKQIFDDDVPSTALLGGRRSGKTLPASRQISGWAQDYPRSRWACIAPTFKMCKTLMFEGATGLLSVLPESALFQGSVDKAYNSTGLVLKLANEARIEGFTSERPGNIRGQEFWGVWGDELGEWRDANFLPMDIDTTFSNAMLANSGGKRYGWEPKAIFTMTPKPVRLLAGNRVGQPGLLTGYGTEIGLRVVRMSSRENIYNLPDQYKRLIRSLEGSRIGRQEIEGELLSDIEGALWHQAWIRLEEPPETDWVAHAVGLDHAVTGNERSDETGIIVAGLHSSGFYWVLEDHSGRFSSPDGWSRIIADIVARYPGISVITEPNQGGDLIEQSLKFAGVPKSVLVPDRAFRSKRERFEPARQLYEPRIDWPDGQVRHAMNFPLLVDQLCSYTGSAADDDDRIDALAAALRWLGTKADHTMHDNLDLSGLTQRSAWF